MNPIVENLIGGGIKGAFDGIKNLIQTFKMSPEKAADFELEKQKLLAQIEQIKLTQAGQIPQIAAEIEKAILADVQNSRAMQVAALNQDDKFSKRFIYLFTIGYALLSFAFIFCVCFAHIPEENRDIVHMAFGAVVGSGFMMVLSFFFGSSKGARDHYEKLANNALMQNENTQS